MRALKKIIFVIAISVLTLCVASCDNCQGELDPATFDDVANQVFMLLIGNDEMTSNFLFEHPENFIVEGIGTIADILSGDIYEGVEYPLEIMAKLQQNCKTNFDGTRMQKSIELLEKTLQQNIEEVSKGNIQSVESLAHQVVPEMEDVKDVDKTENRIERDILGKSQTEEKLK